MEEGVSKCNFRPMLSMMTTMTFCLWPTSLMSSQIKWCAIMKRASIKHKQQIVNKYIIIKIQCWAKSCKYIQVNFFYELNFWIFKNIQSTFLRDSLQENELVWTLGAIFFYRRFLEIFGSWTDWQRNYQSFNTTTIEIYFAVLHFFSGLGDRQVLKYS